MDVFYPQSSHVWPCLMVGSAGWGRSVGLSQILLEVGSLRRNEAVLTLRCP